MRKKKEPPHEIVQCPECGTDVILYYYPGFEGKLYGPPGDCEEPYPSSCDVETDECEKCGTPFDDDVRIAWLDVLDEEKKARDDRW